MNRNPCSKEVSRFMSVLTFASIAIQSNRASQCYRGLQLFSPYRIRIVPGQGCSDLMVKTVAT